MKSESSTTQHLSQSSTDFKTPYFDHVLAEYELVTADGGIPPRVQEILEKRKTPDQLDWGDVYLLEKYVVCKQPEEVLRARLPGLRLNYREIVGPAAFEQYLQSRQAAPTDGPIEELRADVGRLLDALHWAYAMAPKREQVRTGLLRNIGLEMLIFAALAVGAVLLSAALGQMLIATVILVLLLGALGGSFSVQQRIEKIPTEQDPILAMFQLQQGRFAVRLAPLTGAICALVLFLVFQAELLKGTVFPSFNNQQIPPGAEYGKLLVWSFIAGFAERFVPDTLNHLVPKHEEVPPEKIRPVLRDEEKAGKVIEMRKTETKPAA